MSVRRALAAVVDVPDDRDVPHARVASVARHAGDGRVFALLRVIGTSRAS
jgi:hypothetical protein